VILQPEALSCASASSRCSHTSSSRDAGCKIASGRTA
jgi:hypothetical protein